MAHGLAAIPIFIALGAMSGVRFDDVIVARAAGADDRPTPISPGDELVEAGRRAFAQHDCLHCHSLAGYGGQMGPELLGITDRRQAEWLVRHLVEPDSVMPTTLMPPFGPEPVARALTAFLGTLRTPADAEPTIRPFLEGARRLRTLPAAVMNPDVLPSGRRVRLRRAPNDAVNLVYLEDWRREGGAIVMRQERYEPRERGRGWRRYLDDRVTLDARTMTMNSMHTVMDGVVHDVGHDDDMVTLRATRPGTVRGWVDTRRLPQPLYDISDDVVAAIRLSPGASAAYWVFGMHGGAVARIVTAEAGETPDMHVFHVVTPGLPRAVRWVRVRGGRYVSTTVGATPNAASRYVIAEPHAAQAWLAALNADTKDGWVKGPDPSLLDSWPRR